MDLLGLAHAGEEHQLLPKLSGGMPMTADQQIAEHGGILEQFDVLEGAGNPELGDTEGGRLGDVLILEINLA